MKYEYKFILKTKKSTITTRVNVTKNEGNLPYMKSADILVVNV